MKEKSFLFLGFLCALALAYGVPIVGPLFRAWAVSLHEVGHAFGALLTGGSIASLDVQWTHGTAWTRSGWYPVVSMAGYTATALAGLCVWMLQKSKFWKSVWLVWMLTASVLLIVYNPFNLPLLFALICNVVITLLLFKDNSGWTTAFVSTWLYWLQWQDVQQLLFYQPENTDAALLAQHLGMGWLMWPIALFYSVFPLWLSYKGYVWHKKAFLSKEKPLV